MLNPRQLSSYIAAATLCAGLCACQIPEAPEAIMDTPSTTNEPNQGGEQNKGTLRGYIDKKGAWIIKPQFVTGSSFSEGLAHVVDPRGSYIDKNGNFVIKENYYVAGDFHEGLAWAAKPVGSWRDVNSPGDQLRYGYINKSGKFVIPPQFQAAHDFSEGMALVMPTGEKRWGFINKQGKMVIKPQFDILIDEENDSLPQFKNGTAYVSLEHHKSFSIDKTGKPLSDEQSQKAFVNSLSEGRGLYRDKEGKHGGAWGYFDKTGNVAIRCIYDKVTPFSDGLALVRTEGKKWSFIDRNGKTVIPPTSSYDFLSFHDGMVQCRERDGMVWGYMDRTGKVVIPPQFPNAESFSEGMAAVDVLVPEEKVKEIKFPFQYTVQGTAILFPLKFSASDESSKTGP